MELKTLQERALNMMEYQSDYLLSFIDYLDLSKKTIESYRGALKCFSDYLESNAINNPTRNDIINYRTDLINRGLKPTTMHAYINAVKKAFEWLSYNGLYKNIAINVKSVKISNLYHRKDSLTLSQAKEILNYYDPRTLEGKRNYAIILLCLECGLRVIELERANINDIRNMANNRVIFIQGKGHEEKDRYNKISPMLDNALRDYLKARDYKSEDEPLFTSLSDRNSLERLKGDSISRIIKRALRGVGLNSDRLTAHSLRHTTATLNILLGGSLEETQELLRHANPNTTMIYINENNRASNNSELRIETALLTR